MPKEIITDGPGSSTLEASEVVSIDYTGDCWAEATVDPQTGDFTKYCTSQNPQHQGPCVATVTLSGGGTMTFEFSCTTTPHGHVKRVGGASGTYHFNRWVRKIYTPPA